MLRMESRSSENSLNFSEKEPPAWVKLWNTNYGSTGGLSLGSDNDLAAAIGDKEVAAKAVAFVVNSTRKGIVPLCADVANLLRAKRSLEDRILQLSKENDSLRILSDGQDSLTGSTVTRSKHAEQTDSSHQEQNSSICSSNEPNVLATVDAVKAAGDEHSEVSSASSRIDDPARDNDQLVIHPAPAEDELVTDSNVVRAEVHASPGSTNGWREDTWSKRQHHRSPSLSSSERSSNRSLEMNPYDDKLSTMTELSKRLNKTILCNNKLTEELNAARATIDKLQKEVRDFRVFGKGGGLEVCDGSNYNRGRRATAAPDLLPVHHKPPTESEAPPRASLSSCHVCAEAQRSARANGILSPRLYKHDAITLFTSENMLVNIGDSILTFSNHCGTVRFIGHVDGFTPMCLYVGVQLADKVDGGLDGTFNGRRYFSCPKGRGIFIQPQDIVNVLSKKQASVIHKSKKPNKLLSSDNSPPSSSSSMSTGGLPGKLRKGVFGIRHTHSQKRISLPSSTGSSGTAATSESRQSTKRTHNQPNMITTEHLHTSEEMNLPEGLV